MSDTALSSLAALIAPRTVRILPARGEPGRRVALGRGCRVVSSGAVDVALICGAAGVPAQARAAVLLDGARAPQRRSRSLAEDAPLALGPGAGLWAPGLRAGLAGAGTPSPGESGWLVLTQGCGLAERVLRAAARRSLPIRAALSTGAGGPSLLQLAELATRLEPKPRLLLALHRPTAFADLLRFGLQRPAAVVLLVESAEVLAAMPGAPDAPRPGASQLCRSLGLPVTRTAEQLADAAALLQAGVRRRHGLVLGLAPRTDEAVWLADAMGRAGLGPGGTGRGRLPAAAVVRTGAPAASGKARGVDATVVIDGPGAAPRVVPASGGPGLSGDGDTLRALTALLEPAEPPSPTPPTRALPPTRQARLLLDAWPAELSEVEVKALLAAYGLPAPDEQLTGSASAAARVAGELASPVAVKAVGPTLRHRESQGALRLGVEGGAAVRQTFRDVLDACARLKPPTPLSGVLVSRMVPLPFALDVSLVWPDSQPPLLVGCRRREDDEVVALPCPIGGEQAAWAADRLLGAAAPAGNRTRLAAWLRKLAALALDLEGRLRWIHLDTVSPPEGNSPPLIIDGCALQTASFRDPLGLHADST